MPKFPRARTFAGPCLAVLVALGLALSCAAPLGPAAAQEAQEAQEAQGGAAGITEAQLETLVQTLESEEQRERFLSELKALLAAHQATTEEELPSAGALKFISDGLGRIGDQLIAIGRGLAAIPQAARWLWNQWTTPESRDVWIEVVWKLAVVIGAGIIVAYLVSFGLRRPRRLIEAMPRPNVWLRPFILLGHNLLRLVPALAFAGAGYGLLAVLDPSEVTRLVALSAINALLIASAVKLLASQALAPWTPNLRLASVTDETAVYGVVWWGRLVNLMVYGYFVCQAALLLGLPEIGYSAIVKVLGLIVTGLVIVLILQNRKTFANWVRSGGESRRWRALFSAVYRVADFWHILAIIYVIAGAMLAAAEGIDGFLFFIRSTFATIALIWAIGFAMSGVRRAMARGFRVSPEVAERYPGLQARINRYLPVARKIFQGIIAVLGAMLVLESWNVDIFTWLASETGRLVIGRLAVVLAIALVALLIWEIVSALIDRYLQAKDEAGELLPRSQRIRTLLPLARNALRVIIGIVALLMILTEIGIDIAPILAGVGVVGLAIGFGAQTLVKDIITGVFILLEDSLAVGDVVTVGGQSGLVEAITIRSVRMRDLSGNVHTIPYSAIDTVTNMTKEFSYYLIEAGVAYRENYDEVVAVMREVADELREDPEFGPSMLEPIEILGLDRFADSAVIIRARLKTVPLKQWATGREYNRRLKAAFDARGIEIPFPHQTVYFGEDKEGKAPPAFVRLLEQGAPAKSEEPEESEVAEPSAEGAPDKAASDKTSEEASEGTDETAKPARPRVAVSNPSTKRGSTESDGDVDGGP